MNNNAKPTTLPPTTKACICANCGAVSLDPESICRPQGLGTKADWCGIKQITPQQCHNKVNTKRYSCENCEQVSTNPELLCQPVKMDIPE